jgi:hypothetical protein
MIDRDAYEELHEASTDVDDATLAGLIADYYIVMFPSVLAKQKWHFSIFHDVRKRSTAGPCPLEFDWQHKNVVGISTKDSTRARDWAVRAMVAGYAVFHSFRRNGSGGSQGTLAQFRERKRVRDAS